MGSSGMLTGAYNEDTTLSTPVAINKGGTGQTTAQAALDALAAASGSLVQGDILIVDASTNLVRLARGTDNYVLTMNGSNPNWEAVSAGVSLSDNNTWTGTNTFNNFINSTPTELTISSARITATRMCHKVDCEGDASTDNLDWIDGYGYGRLLSLQSENSGRDPTLRDEQGGNGSLNMSGDLTLTNVSDSVSFIGRYSDGITWVEISRSDNG